jgi:predicted nuclease of predicted toxin-antitoxin system
VNLFLDTCISRSAREFLRSAHDVTWQEGPHDPGDAEILRRATDAGRIVVTIDKDFGELAVARQQPHGGIVRLVDLRSVEQGPFCHAALEKYAKELAAGAVVTVERHRVRVRPG